jgi:hypothetical protein
MAPTLGRGDARITPWSADRRIRIDPSTGGKQAFGTAGDGLPAVAPSTHLVFVRSFDGAPVTAAGPCPGGILYRSCLAMLRMSRVPSEPAPASRLMDISAAIERLTGRGIQRRC